MRSRSAPSSVASRARESHGSAMPSSDTVRSGMRPKFGAIKFCSQREEPGGKGRFPAPTMQKSVSPEKCLLRQIFGTAAVVAKPVRQINEWPLPAAYDASEGGHVAPQNFLDIRLIHGGTHDITSYGMTNSANDWLHFLSFVKITQPRIARNLSYSMKRIIRRRKLCFRIQNSTIIRKCRRQKP